MFPYHRLLQIFKRIQIGIIDSSDLASLFNVSERTIRSDIQLINEILNEYGAHIKLKRKQGYYLEINEQTVFTNFLTNLDDDDEDTYELSSFEDRIQFLLKELLYSNGYSSMEALANLLYISKNTLNNYIKTLRPVLDTYHLEYIVKVNEGCKVIGKEEDKRKCLLDNVISHNMDNYITGFTKEEIVLFEGLDLEEIKSIVVHHINRHDTSLHISDFNLKNIIIHFALTVSRVLNHCSIETYLPIEIQEDVYTSLEHIKADLEKAFSITINAAEINYIYSHFVANTNYGSHAIKTDEIVELVEQILVNIVNNYSFDLQNDETLKSDLILHFSSILNSKQYSIDKKNPLLNTIKNNFPLAYEISLTAIRQVFTNKKYQLTEDEIGYVALHIGAAIERCFSGVIQRKKVMLVCGSGNATVRMLEARLDIFFKDKINIVRKASYNEFIALNGSDFNDVDFVISTIPLRSDVIPTICIDFALNTKDIEAISKFIANIAPSKSKRISRFFDENLFITKKTYSSKEILLKEMCDCLSNQGYCDHQFFESVMHRESLASTNMNEVFALPHPMDLCANATKVCVAILDEPLIWNNDHSVRIIFLLAIKQNEYLDIEYLYETFIELVNNVQLQHAILQSKKFDTFIELLNNHLDN